MALKKDYGLPDETLQLIAAVPSLFAGGKYLQPRTTMSSRQDPSQLIAALRASGTDNNGFTQYANSANADSASARTARRGLFAPSKLTMGRVTRDVTLPTAEPLTPYTRTPRVMGPLPVNPDPDPVDPVDPVDPPSVDPVDPGPENPPPSIYTTPIVTDIPDETDPDTIPLIPAPDILETVPSIYTKPIATDIPDDPVDPSTIPLIPAPDILETVPSIYTKPIPTDIPDDLVNPSTIPWIIPEFPLELPEIPDPVEKKDASFFDDPDFVEYGPSKGLQKNPEDLPEEFDKYLVEIMNSLGGGGGAVGGGKPADDTYGNILEM